MVTMLAMAALIAAQAASPVPAAPPASAPAPAPTIAPGTISLTMAPGARGEAIDPAYAEAVGHALAEAGFTLLRQPGHARYAAEITVTQEAHGSVIAEAPRRPPWVSGGTQSGRTGGSVSVPLPSGKGQVSTLVSTAIEIRIRQRADADDAAPRWSGRAATAQATGTREGAPAAVAAKLVGALFRNFPADSGLSISVP